ncbi:MAG TPA: hypothetical protein VJB70_03250 [Candidatus Paceibacterota bacterium]
MLRIATVAFGLLAMSPLFYPAPLSAQESAIERALKNKNDITDEDLRFIASLGVSRGVVQDDEFKAFIRRLHANPALRNAFEEAGGNRVRISANSLFAVSPGLIQLDITKGSDDYLIAYVKANIREATRQQELETALSEKKSTFGVSYIFIGIDEFASFVRRVEKNPDLEAALLKAKEAGVSVSASDKFKIYSRLIIVDTRADDAAIISFLLGK